MQRRVFVGVIAAVPCVLASPQAEAPKPRRQGPPPGQGPRASAMVRSPGMFKELNGRWDITVPGDTRRRAWWLEIKDAESGKPAGSFIGAPGGGLDLITNATVEDGELRWSFNTWRKGTGKDAPRRTGTYRAHLIKGKLEGTLEVEGDPVIKWIGSRAPVFPKVTASQLKEAKPVELFNGKDLKGWVATRTSGPVLWSVENGVLKNQAGTTDIMTEATFQDFKLHAEFKVGEHSNSGIGLRGRYEIQILDDHGRPPGTHGMGALYSRVAPVKNASKPAGEWQTYDITLVSNHVTVVLNGEKLLDNVEIDGLTAMAIDPNEAEPGPIVIQGDHGPVEFRKLTLTPLVKK